jgi:hypothetical protein
MQRQAEGGIGRRQTVALQSRAWILPRASRAAARGRSERVPSTVGDQDGEQTVAHERNFAASASMTGTWQSK